MRCNQARYNHLNGGRSVVNAVLLEEGELAVLVEEERALNAGERVGGAGHQLGVNELCRGYVVSTNAAGNP